MIPDSMRKYFILVGALYTAFSIVLLLSLRRPPRQEEAQVPAPSEAYALSEDELPPIEETAAAETEPEATVSEDQSEAPEPQEIFYDVPCYNYNKRNVMVRDGPSLSNKVIGKIKPKAHCMALYLSKDERVWTAVSYNGLLGYSSLEVLEMEWDKAAESAYSEEFFIENGLDPKGSVEPGQ